MKFLILSVISGTLFYLAIDIFSCLSKKVNLYLDSIKNFLMSQKFIQKYVNFSKTKLERAGLNNTSVGKFIFLQFLTGFFLFLFFCILLEKVDILNLLLSFALAGFLSFVFIESRIRKRQREIFKALPDIIDLLTLMVGSGLDFWTAIEVIIQNEKNIVAEELRTTKKEVDLGKNRYLSLQSLSKRLDNKYITSVCNSIIYALQLGIPIVETLKSLSDELHTEKSYFAEKVASEAPVKMTIPIILFIFPTVFIMIFGPILYFFFSGRF